MTQTEHDEGDLTSLRSIRSDTGLPSYVECDAQGPTPRYVGQSPQASVSKPHAVTYEDEAVRLCNSRANPKSFFKRRRFSSQALDQGNSCRRLPAEHLCLTPDRLPAASSNSPFDDLISDDTNRRALSRSYSMPVTDHATRRTISSIRHTDHDYHRLHGLSDNRMHASPELDEHGRPKRNMKAGPMIAGAAIGVLAVAACNIM